MAERKSGPVKPPILDLEARKDADAEKTAAGKTATGTKAGRGAKTGAGRPSAAQETGGAQEKAHTGTTGGASEAGTGGSGQDDGARAGEAQTERSGSADPARGASRTGPALVGLAGGAVLGLVLSYGVAYLGYWPAPNAQNGEIAALRNQVESLQQKSGANASGLSQFNDRVNALETSAKNDIATLTKSVSDLQDKVNAGQNVDLGPIEKRISALSDRIDAIAAGASSSDAQALSKGMATNRDNIATLSDTVSGLKTSLSDLGSKGSDLASRVSALENRPPPDASAAAATAVRLPMALGGLRTALDNGRPYANELSAITTSLPGLSVPATVANAAKTGLPRPDRVASELHAAVPDMLAAKPAPQGADWKGVLLDRIKSLVAMRPAGGPEGDSPDAVVARIEAAVNRHDFATARDLFGKLPRAMVAAAGNLPDRISALADAYGMIARAREAALQQAPGGAQ